MGHDERRAAGDRSVECLENLVLRLAVDGRRRIIQQQNRRFQQDGAGNREALALTAGEGVPALAQDGVVAFRQAEDKIVRGRDARGSLNLRGRRLRVPKRDVRGDGIRKEKALLKHEADIATEVIKVELPRVDAVEEQPPGSGIEEARDEAHQHALARTRRAEDRDTLPRLHREVNFPHHRLRTVVGERNVFEADFTGELGAAQGGGRAFHLDGRIENFEYPPRTDQRLLHTVHNVDDVVDLSRKLFEQTGKDDESSAEGQPVLRHEPAAVTQQNDNVDARQETDRRRKQTQPPKNPALLVETGLVGSFKFSAIFGLAPKSFRDSDPLDTLGQRLHHTFDECPVVRVFGLNFPGKPRRHQPQHRRRRETGQRQTRMQTRHVEHVNRERDDHNHALHEHLIDKHPHRLHIARHPGDDRARRVGIEETEA